MKESMAHGPLIYPAIKPHPPKSIATSSFVFSIETKRKLCLVLNYQSTRKANEVEFQEVPEARKGDQCRKGIRHHVGPEVKYIQLVSYPKRRSNGFEVISYTACKRRHSNVKSRPKRETKCADEYSAHRHPQRPMKDW